MSHTLVATLMKVKTGSPISKLILLKLADNADIHGRCFPSYQYLAQYCEVSLRTVKQHVRQLETLGLIELIHRFDKRGRQRSNLYQIRTPPHLHIELHTDTAFNCIPQEAASALSGSAATAPINSHKEYDLVSGGQISEGRSPLPVRVADQLVADFAANAQPNPFAERIEKLIRQRREEVADTSADGEGK
uniref:Transcriptional regulator n=1 Tax=Vibrio alginolyticus TaxID=663 RepID=A0A0N9DYT9_VIBAL|nr:Transcriptional regulator [Vibrio alginolyticus]